MDFFLNDDQESIMDAIGTIVSRYAGPSRLRALGGDQPAYDFVLEEHLIRGGYLELSQAGHSGRLDSVLVVERLSCALSTVSAGYQALVAPSLKLDVVAPISIVPFGYSGPARFACVAKFVVVVADDHVSIAQPNTDNNRRVDSRLGWPVGQIDAVLPSKKVPAVDPTEILMWWKIALTAELVGTMEFAVNMAVEHVTNRHQFGKAIGSFQTVQHGLAECAVSVEAARWLVREAAWQADGALASVALSRASRASLQVLRYTHQYCGAMGFTSEFDLHLATMRLPALQAEAMTLANGSPSSRQTGGI